jgi:hypothetical protein
MQIQLSFCQPETPLRAHARAQHSCMHAPCCRRQTKPVLSRLSRKSQSRARARRRSRGRRARARGTAPLPSAARGAPRAGRVPREARRGRRREARRRGECGPKAPLLGGSEAQRRACGVAKPGLLRDTCLKWRLEALWGQGSTYAGAGGGLYHRLEGTAGGPQSVGIVTGKPGMCELAAGNVVRRASGKRLG